MSIEEKIAKLMEEAKKLESSEEVVSIEEETAEEVSEEAEIDAISEEIADQVIEELGIQESEKTPAMKRAIASAWKQRTKARRVGDMAAGYAYTGMGHPKSPEWSANADAKYKKQRERVKSMKEEFEMINLGTLFEGEEFSEEFKTKAAELFEAAVEARIKQEVARIEEEVSQRSLTESAELKEGLVDKVDGYLDYVVEQWMQKNELALDRGIKVEIFESFVSGMKDLFETHYIDVPEEKFDLMESVDAKAKTLEEQVDFLTAQNVELQQKFKAIAKEKQIEEACKELTDLEAERFKQLSEELAYDDEESFGKKLELVKENYISKAKQAKSVIVESIVTDSPVELTEEKQVDPSMARYLSALKAR